MSFPTPPPLPDAAPEPTTCFYHRDRETGRKCTRCGRPACPDCLHQASVGSHCWECIKAAAPPRREQIRRAVRGNDHLVSSGLIALNTIVFLIGAPDSGIGSRIGEIQARYALFAPAIDLEHEWYRLLTSGFVHFGLFHIAMNMFILYQLGLFMERDIGRVRFMVIYFVSLLGGSAGALVLDPLALTAGASGAVFGLAAAAVVAQRQRGTAFTATAFGPFIILNIVLSFGLNGISLGGHLGGAIAGALCGAAMLSPYQDAARVRLGYAVSAAVAAAAVGLALIAAHSGTQDACARLFTC